MAGRAATSRSAGADDRGDSRGGWVPSLGVTSVVVERVDLAPGEFGGQALRVPVREDADDDHRLRDPARQTSGRRPAWSIEEGPETIGLVAAPPAMEGRPAGPKGASGRDAVLPDDADAPGAKSKPVEIGTLDSSWRPTAAGGQEEETRPFLIHVTEQTTMRLGALPDRGLIHAPTLGRVAAPYLKNPGNYA